MIAVDGRSKGGNQCNEGEKSEYGADRGRLGKGPTISDRCSIAPDLGFR